MEKEKRTRIQNVSSHDELRVVGPELMCWQWVLFNVQTATLLFFVPVQKYVYCSVAIQLTTENFDCTNTCMKFPQKQLVLCISNANELPCVLISQKQSESWCDIRSETGPHLTNTRPLSALVWLFLTVVYNYYLSFQIEVEKMRRNEEAHFSLS